MKIGQIVLRVFAVIGLLMTVTGIIGGYSAWRWLNRPVAAPKAPDLMVLELDFTQPVVEKGRDMSFALGSFLEANEETQLIDIVRALDRAKDDDRVMGVVARMGADTPSLVHAQEIRDALKRFREKGKFSYVFAPSYGSFGMGNRSYYLASAFQNIWLQPAGTVGLTGLGVETPFGKTALGKIGISGDFMRREEYKSVMENVMRDDFSPDVRDNLRQIMSNLSEQFVSGIAQSRKIPSDTAKSWLERGPYTASEALREGIVTHIGYDDDMLDTAKLLGSLPDLKTCSPRKPAKVTVSAYLGYAREPPETVARVALINGLGMIVDAPSGPAGLADQHIIDTGRLVKAFNDAAEDDDVEAILFRVDSPGGAPDASETIRHALVKAKEAKKPVFVSMGEVAASGGYWIAMNADHIVAEPGTLTGSIGVVAGKFVFGELSDKLGITWDTLTTSDNARMWSLIHPFDAKGRERVNALLDDTYKTFTENVAAARKIPLEKMPEVAKGRVWTGDQALKAGLVDELGGMATTVAAIKKHLKLDPTDAIELKLFPPPESPASLAIKILRNLGIEAAMLHGFAGIAGRAQEALGPLWDEMAYTGPVAARVPSVYLGAVR